jgi:formylmethanofuran dehydrogenase subunit E
MMNAFMKMSEDQIFSYRKVEVLDAKSYRRPPRVPRINCSGCGEEMLGGEVVLVEGRTLCPACAGQAYYRVSRS